MSYDLHITRRKDWSSSSAPKITAQEWLDYAEANGALSRQEEKYLFTLDKIAIDWSGGGLTAYCSSEDEIAQLHKIASELKAKVQGDDGEVYLPNGEVLTTNNSVRAIKVYPKWLIGLCIVGIACYIIILFEVFG